MKINKVYKKDVNKLLSKIDDGFVDCIFTDIPYLVKNGGSNKSSFGGHNTSDVKQVALLSKGKLFKHNDISPNTYLPELFRVLKETGHIYIMTNSTHLADVINDMKNAKFTINNILVMVKNNAVVNQHYMKNCEFTIYARKGKQRPLNNRGVKSALDTMMPNPKTKTHPTEKPVEYIKTLIGNSTQKGDVVLDPFCGSGSTGEACKALGLNYILNDIDKEYYKKTKNRIKKC